MGRAKVLDGLPLPLLSSLRTDCGKFLSPAGGFIAVESVSLLFGDGSVPSFAQIALLRAPEVLAIRCTRDEAQDEISI